MTQSDDRPDYLERARMHDRLATTTNDAAARQMHQAMATEFRRRAAQPGGEIIPPQAMGPVLEMSPAAS